MEAVALQINAEFFLNDLRNARTSDVDLRRLVRKELCRIAEICYLEDVHILPMLDEVFNLVKAEVAKFKAGPKEFYPDTRHNVLKIQITMPTCGKVGVLFWHNKVMV